MTSKRLVLFVALVGLLFVMAGVGTVAAQSAPDCSAVSYNGAGTEANPYEVGNVDQLQCIEEQGLDANYEVVSDIDASETAAWNSGKGFDPLGDDEDDSVIFFTGTFDGGSHTITDLTINRPSEDTVALFEAVGDGTDNGKVKDIRFEWVDVTGSATVAPLAGSNLGTIIRSSASGNADGDDNVGGLVGRNQNGEVSDSYATTEVEGSGSFGQSGGLVGFNSGTIERSHATGDVVGTSRAGGIVRT
ncbi:MAG: GLUG motif-containing protein [Halobacteriales archaeon]|nr:GLUG motif-containing protein [Halobacteriales archaeon]